MPWLSAPHTGKGNELESIGIKKEIGCVLTRTLVDKDDPHFKSPSKPIGPFYDKEESDAITKKVWVDHGKGE